MTEWVAAEKRGHVVRMWAMPAGTPTEGAQGPVVMAGATVPARPVPCAAVPESLISGQGGGFLFPPMTWDGQISDGAEARIAGVVSARGNWDGIVCVVGDSTVWAHVSAGEVISFQRFATARLAAAMEVSDVWDGGKLRAALADAMARPERLAAYIARAGDAGTLWGALLGAELAAARPYWLGQDVVLVGDGRTVDALEMALAEQGVPVARADGDEMLLLGLQAAVKAQGGPTLRDAP